MSVYEYGVIVPQTIKPLLEASVEVKPVSYRGVNMPSMQVLSVGVTTYLI